MDTTAPAAPVAVNSTPASPGRFAKPTIRFTSVTSGDTVNIYSDSGCATQVGSGTAGAFADIIRTNAQSAGTTVSYYAKAYDAAGNASTCSAAAVSYQYILPSVTVSAPSATEGGNLIFNVTLDYATDTDVTFDINTESVTGTATAGSDYTSLSSSRTIVAGSLNESVAIIISTNDDALDEPNETVKLTASNISANATIATATGTGTLNDNDAAPTINFASTSQSIWENTGTTTATVSLSAVSGQNVTVNYTYGGTAVGSGTDYSDAGAGTIVIPAGSSSANISLGIVDDGNSESNETIVLTLSGATNGTIGGTTVHTATIKDNDIGSLVFTTQPTSSNAGTTLLSVVEIRNTAGQVITSGGDAGSTVTLSLQSGTGSLLGTTSKSATSGVVSFGAGEAVNIAVAGISKIIRASVGGFYVDSSSFNITPAAANTFAFTSIPTNPSISQAFAVSVELRDSYGNVVTSDTSSVTLSLASGTGNLTGNLTKTLATGQFSWVVGDSVSIDTAGNFTLRATGSGTSAGITGDSGSITVVSTVPALASATISNSSPTNTTTYSLTYGAVTGAPTDYCILENDTTVGNCSWINSGTLPSTFVVTSTNTAKTLSIWVKNAGGTSTRVDTNSVLYNPPPTIASVNCFRTLYAGSGNSCAATANNITDSGDTTPNWVISNNTCPGTPSVVSSTGAITYNVPSAIQTTNCSFDIRVNDGLSNSPTWNILLNIIGDQGNIQLITAANQNCVLRANGTAKCWGNSSTNSYIGSGYNSPRYSQNSILSGFATELTGISQVVLSSAQGCALTSPANLTCFGTNASTIMPASSTYYANQNIAVSNVQSLQAGTTHICYLNTSGAVKCWGLNTSGQLGDGTITNRSYSTPVTPISANAVQVSAGALHTCALMKDGSISCWGQNTSGQLGIDSGTNSTTPVSVLGYGPTLTVAKKIAAGGSSTCAIDVSGNLKCWGLNGSGQLGQDATANLGDGLGEMAGLANINLGASRTAVDVAIGASHACALLDNSTVKCWGLNANGQLGQGNTATLGDGVGEMAALASINLGAGLTPVSVKVGTDHTCVMGTVTGNMTTKCFGKDNFGQLGLGYALSHTSIGTTAGHMGANLSLVPECKFGLEIIDTDVHSRRMVSCQDSTGTNTLTYANANTVCSASHHVCTFAEFIANSTDSPSTLSSWVDSTGFGTWAISGNTGTSWSPIGATDAPIYINSSADMCGSTFVATNTTPPVNGDRCTSQLKTTGAYGAMCCPN